MKISDDWIIEKVKKEAKCGNITAGVSFTVKHEDGTEKT